MISFSLGRAAPFGTRHASGSDSDVPLEPSADGPGNCHTSEDLANCFGVSSCPCHPAAVVGPVALPGRPGLLELIEEPVLEHVSIPKTYCEEIGGEKNSVLTLDCSMSYLFFYYVCLVLDTLQVGNEQAKCGNHVSLKVGKMHFWFE